MQTRVDPVPVSKVGKMATVREEMRSALAPAAPVEVKLILMVLEAETKPRLY